MAEAEENGDLDWISWLPDDLLSHILSSLAVEDAVRTKLLSRRWRHLFPLCAFLHFDTEPHEYRSCYALRRPPVITDQPEMFVAWVDTVMQQFKAPKMGSLYVNGFVESKYARNVDEWIRLACLGKTVSLNLCFRECPGYYEPYTFPLHILHASNFSHLRSLLLMNCSLPPFSATAASINSVRILLLRYDCLHKNIGNFECISSYFPNLKELTLKFWKGVPNMRHLCDLCSRLLHLRSFEVKKKYGGPVDFQIDISLEGLNLTFVNIIMSRWSGDGVVNFFSRLLVGVPHLDTLSIGWIDWMDFRFPSFISTFWCLKFLFLRITTTPDADLRNLPIFLRCAPLLQGLSIVLYGKSMEWPQNWLEEHLLQHLKQKEELNSSEMHLGHKHLKKLTISRTFFCFGRNDVELIICLLNSVTSLEKMILCSMEQNNVEELQRALLAHCSPKVKICVQGIGRQAVFLGELY